MRKALLLVDVTEDYLKPWGASYIGNKESERVIAAMKDQLTMARRTGAPVVYAVQEAGEEIKSGRIISDLAHKDDIFIKKPL